jgi:hypothetical protein
VSHGKTIIFRVSFNTRELAGVLDMLRYESGTVVDWSADGENWTISIIVDTNRYQPDRWASFGLFPKAL